MPRKRKYADPDAEKRKLRRLADQLRDIADSDRPELEHEISPDIAAWAANGIYRYLSTESRSLEAALGLSAGKGSKRKPATASELATGKQIFQMLCKGKSWLDIADAIGWQKEESGLRELWQRIELDVNAAVAAELEERLDRRQPGSN